MYKNYIKRLLDIIISLTAIIVLLPIMFFLTVVGYIALKGNPFFYQERPGLNSKIFKLVKFRSMNNKKDEKGNLLSDEERMTTYGKILRKTSLDELPELFNVLKGDMSIVGPRPLLVKYLPLYNKTQARRHEVRPGITGLSVAKVRNGADWETKLAIDIEYVDNVSFLLDLKIIFMTIGTVLSHKGISEEGHVTMSEFKGSTNDNN